MNDSPKPNKTWKEYSDRVRRELNIPPEILPRMLFLPDDWGPSSETLDEMFNELIEDWIKRGWDPVTKTWPEENKKDSTNL